MSLKHFFVKWYSRLRRKLHPYNYTKMNTITDDIYEWCKSIPSDFDTVIAIPRSGLIVGSIISTYFGKPLSTPEMIIENKKWISKQAEIHNSKLDFYGKVLLVDDFVWTGKQMFETKKLLEKHLNEQIICAAPYVNENLTQSVDYYFKTVESNSMQHWDYNLMHGKPGKIAYDLDGVICFDWDNVSDYESFLKTAKPYRIPLYNIDCIVTARLEKYRTITEQWLKDHNVKYSKLYMRTDETQDIIKFKSQILVKEIPLIYVESEPFYADMIRAETGLSVVCTGD